MILTATSGDTGKAALAGFAGVEGTKIMVFYPKHGVSSIQERQMVTTVGANTRVIGINGNFDDAQTSVKNLFTDKALVEEMAQHGMQFSSANSINIGRLTPQIVYYVYAYTRLLADGVISAGDPVNFVVPTGNFGNILAAYYAKRMGLPIGKLICASNSNKVLFDFFTTGEYDRNRKFVLTSSSFDGHPDLEQPRETDLPYQRRRSCCLRGIHEGPEGKGQIYCHSPDDGTARRFRERICG